jgi:hypothetical protein
MKLKAENDPFKNWGTGICSTYCTFAQYSKCNSHGFINLDLFGQKAHEISAFALGKHELADFVSFCYVRFKA